MRRSFVSFVVGSMMLACGGSAPAPAEEAVATGGETVVAPSDPPLERQPEEGSPECAGCTYSSSPGYPGPSGAGGVAEWCMSGSPERTCPMSCCRTARGG